MLTNQKLSTRLERAAKIKRCPECGAPMKESGRDHTPGETYIWYLCTKTDCDGQWLEKANPSETNSDNI